MATRLYFPATDAAAVTPAFDPIAGWPYSSEALRRKLADTKGASAITIGERIGPWTSGFGALDRQYVSTRMAAGVVFTSGSTTVKMQLMCREYNNGDNITILWISVRIVSADGATVRANLYLNNPVVGELINNISHRNETFIPAGTTINSSYTTVLGDRLVVEAGYSDSGATPEASAKWGEDATDLPEDITQTTDGAGWIEFSNTITFAGESNEYSLVVVGASYAFTTAAATLLAQRKLIATNAVYAFTEATVTLRKGFKLVTQEAVYAFTPADVTFSVTRRLIVTGASYSLSTQDAAIIAQRKLTVTNAVYSFVTEDASIKPQRKLSVEPAVYSLATQAAGITAQRKLLVDAAAYSFSTADAGLAKGYKLIVDAAAYAFTEQAAGITTQRKLTVTGASYSFVSQSASLLTQRKLPTVNAVYLFTAQDASLVFSGGGAVLGVDPAIYSFNTASAGLTVQRKLTVDGAAYSFITQDAGFLRGYHLGVTGASYLFTTADASLNIVLPIKQVLRRKSVIRPSFIQVTKVENSLNLNSPIDI